MTQPPLHEIVLTYKIAGDKIMASSSASITKFCAIINLTADTAESMKINSEIDANDINVMFALSSRYMNQL